MNQNILLLIILGLIGLGSWLFVSMSASLMFMLHPRSDDPVRLEWLANMNAATLILIFFLAAIGFGIYNNWRR
jgi:hypothetical protein